jgi:3-oxoadipyl-CoA thiolase
MIDAFIYEAVRTPVGRYGGSLSSVRPDDLAVVPMAEIRKRNPNVDWSCLDDVILGCANQAGEDNRNVARMALLMAGFPDHVPGMTVNRLCASGLNAIGSAAQAIRAGEAGLMIAGGVESMSRAPFVMGKATSAFSRSAEIFDTTIGWRFINRRLDEMYGTDTMPQTAENVAQDYSVSREDQDLFSLWSQTKAATAQADGRLAEEIVPVSVPQRKSDPIMVSADEHLRPTSLETLTKLKPIFPNGSVTAGNASGVNDGAAALLLGCKEVADKFSLTPKARILGIAAAGIPPRIMGMGPVPATQKLLQRLGLTLDQLDILELNEAFASQSLACVRELGLEDDDPRINPLGGAIALGHPLGMSGARLVTSAVHQLQHCESGSLALCTMCVGVGQGVAMVIERV